MKRFLVCLGALLLLVSTGCSKASAPAADSKSQSTQAAAPQPATSQPAPAKPPYFKDQTITILVPFAPGGSADVRARQIGEALQNYIAGKPTVVIKNMPGGNGAIAFNHVFGRVKPDGFTMVVGTPGVTGRWISKSEGHTYDLMQMDLIAGTPQGYVEYVSSKATGIKAGGAEGIKGLINLGRAFRSGHTDKTGGQALTDRIQSEIFGYKLQPVYGYQGYGEVQMNVIKGELEASVESAPAWVTTLAQHTDLIPIVQTGVGADLNADPRLPNVPLIKDVYKQVLGKPMEGTNAFLRVQAVAANLGISFWLPPKTPQSIHDELVAAFNKMAADPAYQETVKKQMGTEDYVITGDEAVKAFRAQVEVAKKFPDLFAQ